MVITVQLQVPDGAAADYLEKALATWAEQTKGWKYVGMLRADEVSQPVCPDCGKVMQWDNVFGAHLCVHVENDLQAG
jgi:hypothetical protein